MVAENSSSLDGAICVECGRSVRCHLYREFSGGTIQLTQCPDCSRALDKYVEFDPVILLLDILLLRIKAYRHLLFNFGLSPSVLWKLTFVVVLCEAYIKLRMLPNLKEINTVFVQVHFHFALLQSALEFLCLVFSAYLLVRVLLWTNFNASSVSACAVSLVDILRAVVISSCGRLCTLAAMVWAGDSYVEYGLPALLLLPAQLQAFRALLGIGPVMAALVTTTQMIATYGLSLVLEEWRRQILYQLIGPCGLLMDGESKCSNNSIGHIPHNVM